MLNDTICLIKDPIGYELLRLYLSIWTDRGIFTGTQLEFDSMNHFKTPLHIKKYEFNRKKLQKLDSHDDP